MMDLSRVSKYYVARGYTDMRRGIDGLATIVTQQFGQELREDSLFLFCGQRTDRIKALYYSGDGYVLLYKRLNNGAFQWDGGRTSAVEYTQLSVADGGPANRPAKSDTKSKAKDLF